MAIEVGRSWPYALAGCVFCILGIGLALVSDPGRGRAAAGVFFGVGGLLLAGYVLGCRALFGFMGRVGERREGMSLGAIGGRGAARNAVRSVTVVASLSSSIFLVVAVGANRHGVLRGAAERRSGTGGFSYYGETALPVTAGLSSVDASASGLLPRSAFPGFGVVPFLVHAGDDAGCLNLNRTSMPRILGVDPADLAERGAFTFVKWDSRYAASLGWELLDKTLPDDEIPAIADQSVLVWGLGKDVGDVLVIKDEEGRSRRLRFVAGLANSVLQGSVVIGESGFRRLFPSDGGARVFLFDCRQERVEQVGAALRREFRDQGLDLERCTDRLAAFNAVENTYLAIFMSLGGLGVLLGSIGLGALVLRNVAERRGEFALLRALGYGRRRIVGILLREHALLVFLGVSGGALAGVVAVLPALSGPGGETSWGPVAGWIAGVAASGFVWIILGALLGLRGMPIEALREE
jgi:hypothetical protein